VRRLSGPQARGGKEDSLKSAEESILTFLSDGEPHPIRQLHNLELPTGLIDEALRHLLAEERLHIDGFFHPQSLKQGCR